MCIVGWIRRRSVETFEIHPVALPHLHVERMPGQSIAIHVFNQPPVNRIADHREIVHARSNPTRRSARQHMNKTLFNDKARRTECPLQSARDPCVINNGFCQDSDGLIAPIYKKIAL